MSDYRDDRFDQDEYGEVLNSEHTYEGIVKILESRGSVVIGWTDQLGSHLDILFVLNPVQVGGLQRGMRWTDLFVAVSHFGMFGFEIGNADTDYGYIGELINGVKKLL